MQCTVETGQISPDNSAFPLISSRFSPVLSHYQLIGIFLLTYERLDLIFYKFPLRTSFGDLSRSLGWLESSLDIKISYSDRLETRLTSAVEVKIVAIAITSFLAYFCCMLFIFPFLTSAEVQISTPWQLLRRRNLSETQCNGLLAALPAPVMKHGCYTWTPTRQNVVSLPNCYAKTSKPTNNTSNSFAGNS